MDTEAQFRAIGLLMNEYDFSEIRGGRPPQVDGYKIKIEDETILLQCFKACDRAGKNIVLGHAVIEHRRTQEEAQAQREKPKPQAAHVISLATFKQAGKGR